MVIFYLLLIKAKQSWSFRGGIIKLEKSFCSWSAQFFEAFPGFGPKRFRGIVTLTFHSNTYVGIACKENAFFWGEPLRLWCIWSFPCGRNYLATQNNPPNLDLNYFFSQNSSNNLSDWSLSGTFVLGTAPWMMSWVLPFDWMTTPITSKLLWSDQSQRFLIGEGRLSFSATIHCDWPQWFFDKSLPGYSTATYKR